MGKEKICHQIGRKFITLLLMTAVFLQTIGMNSFAANAENSSETAVTRMEWLKALSETFEFTIEANNYPDNYYSDLNSSSPDYYDAMLATEFGLIDLEEGEALRPNEAATREFAAHTLNLCLGYVLENETFTFSEANAVTYPEDIQIAVNRGWLSLSNGNFLPAQAITKSEKDLMIAAAKSALASDNSSEDDNSYAYKASVIVLPENVNINSVEENIFEIEECPVDLKTGDIFGKVCEGIPLAWKAVKVEKNGNNALVTVDIVNAEEAFDFINVNQTGEVDLAKLQPASENIELSYVVGGTEAENYQDGIVCATLDEVGEQEITAVMLEQTVDMPTTQADFNIGKAKVKINAQISNLDYKTVSQFGKVGIDYTFKLDFNCNVSVDLLQAAGISPSYELFNAPILPGLYVKGTADLSFYGSANIRLVEDVKLGFHYENHAPRITRQFKKDSFTVTANAKMRAGVRLEAGVKLIGLSGKIFGKVGADITAKTVPYMDGKKPDVCQTISTYIYASVGYDVMVDIAVYKGSLASGNKDIYTQYNSPVKTAFHYEDGKAVSKCTRGTKGMGYGGWGYFSPIDSQYYTIGGSSSGAYGDGEIYTIFEYELDEKNQATITGYRGTAVNVFIPETLDGYPIVGIKENAFKDNQRIRSVSIPDCVKTIGYSAFFGCTALERVTLPENEEFTVIPSNAFYNCKRLASVTIPDCVTKIGSSAFRNCVSLTTIVIPDSVTEINDSAFSECSNLSEIKLSKGLTYLGSDAFYNCKKITAIEIPKSLESCDSRGPFENCSNLKTITFENGTTEIAYGLFSFCDGIERLVIPDTVTIIEPYAFWNCENLSSIIIPDSVTEIGYGAFQDCIKLTSVLIPDSVTKINGSAFSECSNLLDVTLSKGLTSLGSDAFYNCKKITAIEIPKSLESCDSRGPFENCSNLKTITFENGTTEIAYGLFSFCDGIECLVIPDTVTIIEPYAFWNCENLSSIIIPDSVTEIGYRAFQDCIKLTSVLIPDSVTKINGSAFSECSNLLDVTLSKGLTSLGSDAFYNCKKITAIEIPKSLESCDSRGPFENCSNLKTITFENGTTEIAYGLFSFCDGIDRLVIPDTVTIIEPYAFWNCENLSSIIIPDSVTEIGYGAFRDCIKLTSVLIPDSVTEINSSAFSGCTALESAVLPKTLKILPYSIFQNCTALKQITLPNTLTTIEYDAFNNCDALESIILPDSITRIYSNAFYDCDALTSITIPYGVMEIGSQAFYDCDALTTLVLSDTVQTIGNACFKSCDSLVNVTLGAYLTSIPSEAFMDCASLQKLVIPYRVESIRRDAFKNDTQLTAVTIPKSVTEIDSTAFSYPKKLTISGVSGSYANEFATKQGIAFMPIDVPAQELRLNKTELNLYPYDNFDLLAIVRPLDYTGDITFAASDETIVSVTKTGNLRANRTGSAMITVKAGEKTANCRVNVLVPVSRIDVESFSGGNNALQVNESHQLKWSVTPTDAANKKVTFRSSDEEIASVNENGLITAKKAGTVRIYIESADGKASRTIYIEVKEQAEGPKETKNPSGLQTAAPLPTNNPSGIQTAMPLPTQKPSGTPTPTPIEKPTTKPGNIPTANPNGNAPTNTNSPAPTGTQPPVSAISPQKVNKNLVVSADGMLKQIQTNAKDAAVHTIETVTNEEPVLQTKMLDELLENNKDLSISVVDDEYYLIYKWTFNNRTLQNAEKDANLSLTFSDSDTITDIIQKNEKLDDVLTMQCASAGDLPGTAAVQAYVGGKYKENEKLYLYSYDKAAKTVKRINQEPITVKNGYVEFMLNKGETYFFSSQLLNQAPEEPVMAKVWLYGDADHNGAVELQDAQLILLAALGIQNQDSLTKAASDVNLDGQVDLQDAQGVLQIALGISSIEEIQKYQQ